VTKQKGTITNEEGEYSIGADKGDLIQFTFVGMAVVEKFIIDNSDLDVEMIYQVKHLKRIVVVAENKAKASVLYNPKYEKQKNERSIEPVRRTPQEMVSSSGPSFSPMGGIQMSPITMLYYALNKKERRKLNAVIDINKMDYSNQKYSLDFISSITKVDDIPELKDIKAYCYFPHDQVIKSTYYELGLLLKNCYIEYLDYRKLHPIPDLPVTDSIPQDY